MSWIDTIFTGPGINVIFTAIVRAFFVFAPAIGLLTHDEIQFTSLRGEVLDEAKEFTGVLNTRVIMLSWSPLIVVSMISRVEELNRSVKPLSVLVMIIIAFLIGIIGFKVPSSSLRSLLNRWGIFVFVTFLDVLFKLFVQKQIVHILAN